MSCQESDPTPDDHDPMNWSDATKRLTIILVSALTLLASMAATIFAPGVPDLMQEMHSSNDELAAFVVSVYVVGFGIGPLVLAPLSELHGRTILLHCSNVGLIVFSVACALNPSLGLFVFFRLMMGIAGCVPVTIGGGVIADIVPLKKRGPVIGGSLAQEAGWRWIFWLLAIASGTLTIITFATLRETYLPVISKRRIAREERKKQPGHTRNTTQAFCAPSYLYFLFTTFTPVFEGQYNFNTGEAGLAFLGLGVGLVLGVISVGLFAAKYTNPKASKSGRNISPEDRLPPVVLGAILFPAGLIWYGWTTYFRVHWIGTSFVGYGGTLAFLPVQMYLVDAFQLYSASAIATNTVARNIIGATLPLAGGKLYESLGLGWGNTLLGLICVVVIPVPILFIKYGALLRNDARFQVKLD
ncbi:MFS general substrate transporter [Karstenula rhodostoma CBS 690.94]|uniref:MFS general substrate transporter n=1 Tax=Karstenula rhodostoma CBS 690.94 TaxID=1392251 RepID=A0A9P4UHX1_9PLEO|nr:MFS general substrate transporter [Karstenula rhodostoma CBS 690.94]